MERRWQLPTLYGIHVNRNRGIFPIPHGLSRALSSLLLRRSREETNTSIAKQWEFCKWDSAFSFGNYRTMQRAREVAVLQSRGCAPSSNPGVFGGGPP